MHFEKRINCLKWKIKMNVMNKCYNFINCKGKVKGKPKPKFIFECWMKKKKMIESSARRDGLNTVYVFENCLWSGWRRGKSWETLHPMIGSLGILATLMFGFIFTVECIYQYNWCCVCNVNANVVSVFQLNQTQSNLSKAKQSNTKPIWTTPNAV